MKKQKEQNAGPVRGYVYFVKLVIVGSSLLGCVLTIFARLKDETTLFEPITKADPIVFQSSAFQGAMASIFVAVAALLILLALFFWGKIDFGTLAKPYFLSVAALVSLFLILFLYVLFPLLVRIFMLILTFLSALGGLLVESFFW